VPFKLLRAAGQALTEPRKGLDLVRNAVLGLNQVAATRLKPASETPFKAVLGPHRRIDWSRFDLDDAREVKTRLGGKLNDVVLATVAGAVRRFLQRRGLRPEDLEFRAIVPVNLNLSGDAEHEELASRASTLLTQLPIHEPDPRKRMQRVIETTQALKNSGQSQGAEALAQIADWTLSGLVAQLAQLGLWSRAANIVVTNVTGPETPVYILGAPLLESYPVVPLMADQALAIALFSCSGGLHWGLNSDWDALPDLHAFVEALQVEFEELRKAAATPAISVARNRKKGPRGQKSSKTE
jgi:WS/DGAT/MGAT family acyltransferase